MEGLMAFGTYPLDVTPVVIVGMAVFVVPLHSLCFSLPLPASLTGIWRYGVEFLSPMSASIWRRLNPLPSGIVKFTQSPTPLLIHPLQFLRFWSSPKNNPHPLEFGKEGVSGNCEDSRYIPNAHSCFIKFMEFLKLLWGKINSSHPESLPRFARMVDA